VVMRSSLCVVYYNCRGDVGSQLTCPCLVHIMLSRHVAILSVKGTDFRVEKIPLKTVRPYIFSTIDLTDSSIQPELEDEVMSYVSDQVSSRSIIVIRMRVWS